jgi:tetratricopeptide (TPR) repeat protein
MLRVHLSFNHLTLAGALLVALSLPVWAQSPKVQSVEYQTGVLNISASGEFASPQIEVWEGNTGQDPTEIVILTFQDAQADLFGLQRMGEQIMVQNSELKKFLVSPLELDRKGRGGFQITLEIGIQPGSTLFNPTIAKGGSNQWLIALKPGTGLGSNPVNFSNGWRENTQQANAVKPVVSEPGGQWQPEATAKPTCLPVHSDTQALLTQITRLKADLAASQKQEHALQLQLSRYDDILREYKPESEWDYSREKQEKVTIQNLQLALLKLAQKLKTTERELETQTRQNKVLNQELAFLRQELKQDVSTADNPTMLLQLSENKPEPKNDNTISQPAVPFSKGKTGGTTVYSTLTPEEKVALPPQRKPQQTSSVAVGKPAVPAVKAVQRVAGISKTTVQEAIVSPATITSAAPAKPADSKPVPSKTQSKIPPPKTWTQSSAREKQLLWTIKTYPERTQPYLALSELYRARGNWSAAEGILTRLLKKHPAHPQAYYQLAWVYIQEKRKLEAQVALDTYRRLHPSDKAGIQSLQNALSPGSLPVSHPFPGTPVTSKR